jgi:hypothetical protein
LGGFDNVRKESKISSVLDGQAVDRIPTGFWYHFFKDELDEATSQSDLIADNVMGHQKFISDFKARFYQTDERRLFSLSKCLKMAHG